MLSSLRSTALNFVLLQDIPIENIWSPKETCTEWKPSQFWFEIAIKLVDVPFFFFFIRGHVFVQTQSVLQTVVNCGKLLFSFFLWENDKKHSVLMIDTCMNILVLRRLLNSNDFNCMVGLKQMTCMKCYAG